MAYGGGGLLTAACVVSLCNIILHEHTNFPLIALMLTAGVKTRPAESGRGAMVDDAYQCVVFRKQEACSSLKAGDAGVDRVMNAGL